MAGNGGPLRAIIGEIGPLARDRVMWKSYVEIQKEEKESFVCGRWISPPIPNQTTPSRPLRRAEEMLFLVPRSARSRLNRGTKTVPPKAVGRKMVIFLLWDEKWFLTSISIKIMVDEVTRRLHRRKQTMTEIE